MYKSRDDLERVKTLGKPQKVLELFAESYLQGLEYQKWLSVNRDEYEVLYPLLVVDFETVDEDGIVETTYKDNPDFITFEDYMNETRVVSEAIEATYGEDGIELTPYVPEVTELTRPYIAPEVTNTEVDELLSAIGYVPKEVTEALKYLEETDWYIVRFVEAGVEVPEEVLNNRAKAREII